jgi:GDPmannose 4,6-dehydratase
MWQMVRQDRADDYVLATGESHAVRDFVGHAARALGFELEWAGSGVAEQGRDRRTGQLVVAVDPAFYRPTEIELLVGNAAKARRALGWAPRIGFAAMVEAMAESDDRRVRDGRGPI